MNNQKRRVLMVCYHFPPSRAVGRIRSVKFAKYLSRYGWEPVILTVTPESYDEISLGSEPGLPPEENIIRIPMWPSPRDYYLRLLSLRRKKKTGDSPQKADKFIDMKTQSTSAVQRGEKLLSRLKRYIWSMIWLPDDIQGWYFPAVKAGMKLYREKGFDAVFTTGPPWTSHWIARKLSRKTGCPLIADYRDPWTQNPWKPYWVVSALSKRIERWMERKVVQKAARVICNTEQLRKSFLADYPKLPPEHFATITNGFDPDDYRDLHSSEDQAKPNDPSDGLTIAYAGNFYGARKPETLFRALKHLIDHGRPDAKKCRIQLIGTNVPELIQGQAEAAGIADQVEFVPSLPRLECLKKLSQADVLLLLQPSAHLQIPAKLFEYIQLGCPILTLAGPGATQELIENTGAGMVIDPDDISGIARAIDTLMEQHKNGTLGKTQKTKDFSSMDFSVLTGRLAEILDEVTG